MLVGSGDKFHKVRKVPSRFRRQGLEGSGKFRCGLLPCNLDMSSHVIVLLTGITLSRGIQTKAQYNAATGRSQKKKVIGSHLISSHLRYMCAPSHSAASARETTKKQHSKQQKKKLTPTGLRLRFLQPPR